MSNAPCYPKSILSHKNKVFPDDIIAIRDKPRWYALLFVNNLLTVQSITNSVILGTNRELNWNISRFKNEISQKDDDVRYCRHNVVNDIIRAVAQWTMTAPVVTFPLHLIYFVRVVIRSCVTFAEGINTGKHSFIRVEIPISAFIIWFIRIFNKILGKPVSMCFSLWMI